MTAGALISDRCFYHVVVKARFKLPGAGSVAFNAGIGQLLVQLVIGLGMAGQTFRKHGGW